MVGDHWIYLIGPGVVHTCVMYICLYAALQKLPITSIATLSFIYTVVAMLCEDLIYDTLISRSPIAGIPLVFASSPGVNLGWSLLPGGKRLKASQ